MKTFLLLTSLLAATILITEPAAAQSNNFFAGLGAGAKNTTGTSNTFVGASSGANNTSGGSNTFIGHSAGLNNTIGGGNNFFGTSAGKNNISGGDNSFFGRSAGFSNRTGSENVFMGAFAGFFNNSGNENSFFGHSAGTNNTIGTDNSFFGNNAGFSNTNGNNNVFIGSSTGLQNSTGRDNTFVGTSAGRFNSNGLENTFVGRNAGGNNITGKGNTYFGFEAGNPSSLPNLTNATAIGHRAVVSRSNSLVLGSIAGKNGATADVNVGIGVDAPTFQLHLSRNSAAKPGSSSWTVASDGRLKKDVAAFTDGLNVLLKVNPVKYHYNGKAQMPTEKEYVGVIAQQMKEVAPYMVDEFFYEDNIGQAEKYLNYDASALTYVLVNSVKELKKENDVLQQENASLQNKLVALEQKFGQLESRLNKSVEPRSGSMARLWQNAPNPFDHTTVIKYLVPPTAGNAAIRLYNSSGQQVASYNLKSGEGEITLLTEKLAAGTYVYALVVDGAQVESKKLVVRQ